MNIQVEKISTSTARDLAFDIRRQVFVVEQHVEETEEYDEFEETAVHFLASVDGRAAGTARWRKTLNGTKLERFAILSQFRSIGVGSAILQSVVNDLPSDKGLVYLHAQLTAVGLYKKFGFSETGQEFSEAGIMHVKMTLDSTPA